MSESLQKRIALQLRPDTETMMLISVLFLGLLSAGQLDYATFLSEVNKKRAQYGARPVCISKYWRGWCLQL